MVNGGDGNDSLTVLAKNTEIVTAALNGGGGDDVLTGADTSDSLDGGDGNDRLVGAKGGDDMSGGAGNDTLVWNNGDGSDFIDGDAGNDATEVNGTPTLGDVFTLEPNAGRVTFQRTNLVRLHARRIDRALPGQRARRRRLRHGGPGTASARSRCSRSTAAPVRTRSTAPTGRT